MLKTLTIVILLFTPYAQAQIYKCDSDSGMVYSDKPCDVDAEIFPELEGRPKKSKEDAQPKSADEATPFTFEENSVIQDVTSDQISALVTIVRLYGYRCDSVSSAMPFLFSAGYKLRCNRFRYSYEIADKGGKWSVTVD